MLVPLNNCIFFFLIELNSLSREPRKGVFQFLNVWVKHSDFHSIVREVWSNPINSSGMIGFFRKLMAVRKKLR